MSAPTAGDFAAFFAGVYGVAPFPWQRRLAEEVVGDSAWPEQLDLPTGSGKTAAVDIGVFALACRPDVAPRRLVYVVDRRLVVDQVAERVRRLQRALERPASEVVQRVADRLRSLSGDGPPVVPAELRGGMPLDDSWAKRPDQPAVIVSTVDQVGSRLLFRGYGVSDRMLPVHAGMLGNDCLYLLDEVHLSNPFAQTLHALQREVRSVAGLPRRFAVVELSATPGAEQGRVFRIDVARDADPAVTPVLAARLRGEKRARLEQVGRRGDRAEDVLPKHCARAIRALPGATKAVVVNRVETARRTAQALAGDGVETVLLTGRMRPIERDALVARYRDRLLLGRRRDPELPELVLVGTQSIEVGADFDLDAMVTEVASLDALRQRFGRVDRNGELADAGTPAEVLVVAAAGSVTPGAIDPVYGPAVAKTWALLAERSAGDAFDVGTTSPLLLDAPADALAPKPDAPLLLARHLDQFVQTSPKPHADPDVAMWLHGPEPVDLDVQVVWRGDVGPRHLVNHAESLVTELLMACPPRASEAVAVPVGAVRRWLAQLPPTSVSDVPHAADDDAGVDVGRRAVQWRADGCILVTARDLRPGMTIVVPSTYGGLSRGTWDPTAAEPVPDLGDVAQVRSRRLVTLRLDEGVLGAGVTLPHPPGASDELVSPAEERAAVAAWLAHVDPSQLPDGYADVVSELSVNPWSLRRVTGADESLYVLSGRPATRVSLPSEPDGSDEIDSFTGALNSTLSSHCDGVGQLARAFAERCGLSAPMAADFELAGRLHDLGKADPRFQVYLHGGEVEAAAASDLLAKSRIPSTDRARERRARGDSHYPPGMRHELLSVALVASAPGVLADASDPDLVAHLVATHHGRCRALPPVVADPAPRTVAVSFDGSVLAASTDHGLASIDAGIVDRFWRLVERYGPHGLAWLEAIFRLSDHRRSEREAA